MLKAESLACRRGRRLVFRDLDFVLVPGGLMLVTGRNGSGKSSLLRLLAGLLPVFAGELRWNGEPIRDFAAHRARLGYIGHLDALKPELTVSETIHYWHILRGGTETSKDVLAPLGLGGLRGTPVRYLSAGQKRRLALTRLVMSDAPLWLLDEPTTALDAKGHELLAQLIATHRARGGMAVIATHQQAAFVNARHLALDGNAS